MRSIAVLSAHVLSFGAGYIFYAFEYTLEAQAPWVYIGLASIVLLNARATLLFAPNRVQP
jgi:hypothetical protein